MEAKWYDKLSGGKVQCLLCPHECIIAPGHSGRCRVRENKGGTLYAKTYGKIASVALDPIEKKPLYHFFPGAEILSFGTWGCNFDCRFCQNHTLSQQEAPTRDFSVQEAVRQAENSGSIGIAYTYNEPFIMWEYLRDCCAIIHEAGLKNVLVTNGFVNLEPLEELLPFVDAMNIDIKAFHNGFYRELCGGELEPVLQTARRAAKDCHVEITTLVIPEYNDAPKELDELAKWIADNCGKHTPAHLSAYFPRYKLNAKQTPLTMLEHIREIFSAHLSYVYLGNVVSDGGADTACKTCEKTIISRSGYSIDASGITLSGACVNCGADNNIICE